MPAYERGTVSLARDTLGSGACPGTGYPLGAVLCRQGQDRGTATLFSARSPALIVTLAAADPTQATSHSPRLAESAASSGVSTGTSADR